MQLLQDNDDEVNPLDRLANEMGHIGGHVTAVHCHIYGQPQACHRRGANAPAFGLRWDIGLDGAGTRAASPSV